MLSNCPCRLLPFATVEHRTISQEEAVKRSVYDSSPRQVRHELDALPPEERLAIMLVCVEGLSYREAAAQLSTSVEEIRNRLLRGRLALLSKLTVTEGSFPRSGTPRRPGRDPGQRMFAGSVPDAS
ncbi:sigma factor-like helix-turn-helix DNA-binding protein [Skermanella pratensis]|uniref:RNA polymerase sigma factor n=1 Tax=Skermanella pratensis TaxID=2233999 RepID=UPI00130155B3